MQFLAFSVIAGFLAAIIVVPPAVSAGMVANASMSWFQDLPEDIAEGPFSRPSTIYAADGTTEIATFFDENRDPVKLDQISQHMKDTIVSVATSTSTVRSPRSVLAVRSSTTSLTPIAAAARVLPP